MWRSFILAIALVISSCSPSVPAGPRAFERWLAASPERAAAFERFEAMLAREGVADVVPARELWLTDRLAPECVVDPFVAPPEEVWPNIVPALRYIRDYVKPAIGAVTVGSGYRDRQFNDCVGGAPRSAHRGYHALDLLPLDRAIGREALIDALCPIHAREGREHHIGMGVYKARRFHIDGLRHRGWGEDFHAATFPCPRR
jgi:hypothetical protein